MILGTRTFLVVSFAGIIACSALGQCRAADEIEGRREFYIGTLKRLSSDGSQAELELAPTKRLVRFKLVKNAEVVSGLSGQHASKPVRGDGAKELKLSELVNETVFVATQAAKAGRNARELSVSFVSKTLRALPESEELLRIVNGLARSKPAVAEVFTARLHLCELAVADAKQNRLGKSPHLVVGQIVFRGKASPRSIAFQSQVLEEGFFVTIWSEPDKEAEFALHGFKPRLIKSQEDSAVVNLGTVELESSPPAESASVAFDLPAEVETLDLSKDISLQVRSSRVTAWGAIAETDDPLNVPVRRSKSLYMATGLTPGLKYLLKAKSKNDLYSAEFVLEPREKRQLGTLEKAKAAQASAGTVAIFDPAYNRAIENAQAFVQHHREQRKAGVNGPRWIVVTGRLQVEGGRVALPVGRMAGSLILLADGRLVGPIKPAEPCFFRAAGYREKEVRLSLANLDYASDEPVDIGNVALEKLPAEETCAIEGRLQWRSSTLNPPKLKELSLRCNLNWYESRNVGWNAGVSTGSIPLSIDEEGRFSVNDLPPGKYTVSVQGKGIAEGFPEFDLRSSAKPTPIEVFLDRSKRAQVEWIVHEEAGFLIARKRIGEILSDVNWCAIENGSGSDNKDRPDLRCHVVDNEMQFFFPYGPAYIKSLGKGELGDFLKVTPESVESKYVGSVVMKPGHVFLIRNDSLRRSVLIRVTSLED